MTVKEWYETGQYTTLNELNLFYQRKGRGEALICIHGFPSSSWDYEKIWPTLAQHFDVIAPDLIGLGRSSKPRQNIPVALQADMIEALLVELGISRAHILAHDLGDTVAQELLARQAEGTSKIEWQSCIFMNGGLFPETHRPLLIQKLLISPIGGLIAQLMSQKAFQKNMVNVFSREHPPSKAFIADTWQLITENNGKAMIPRLIRYMQERRDKRERWVQPLIDQLIPIRLINGIEDPISGLHMAVRFQAIIPQADIIRIENSGHYPHVETPEDVLAAIISFHKA